MIDYKELKERIDALEKGYWVVPENIDTTNFDFAWRPNPTDRPYIHQFGTQWQKTGGPKFVVPGNEGVKYQDCQRAIRLPDKSKFRILVNSDIEFDYSWHPDDTEPDFTYIFGNQYLNAEEMPTVEYITTENAQKKYIPDIKAKLVSKKEHWVINKTIDLEKFDLSWYPHPYEPPYIYVWGNQYLSAEEMPTVEYHMPGAKDKKYINDVKAKLISDENNWVINDKNIFPMQLDMKWTPHPYDPPYIYAWGNKWIPAELKSTIEYRSPGATEYKYMGNDIQLLPEEDRWKILKEINLDSFDFTWRPDPREPAFIYVWGNQYLSAEEMPTVEYHMPGATDRKYMNDRVANLANNPEYWEIHEDIVKISFDFNWAPHPYDPPYIYAWGNKWVAAEYQPSITYNVPGATEYKYMPELVEVNPKYDRWNKHDPYIIDFDFSWRPDPKEPPFVYVWGNKWVPGEVKPTLEYYCKDAKQIKYMPELVNVGIDEKNWHFFTEINKNSFDFTWRPDPREPAFIYVWGNKWIPGEIKSTMEYHVPGATERKYMSEIVEVLPEYDNWVEIQLVDKSKFDFSWRPDPREPAFIYVWGNKWIPGEIKSTLEYHVPGATEKKYMNELVEVLPDSNYIVNLPIEKSSFDFSWRPDPREPAFIYVWGNQHNDAVKEPTVEYHVQGATERKYMYDRVATVMTQTKNWKQLIPNIEFDFSWRPDPDSPPYIYVWGNQWNSVDIEPTLEYHVPGASSKKYMTDKVSLVKSTNKNWKQLISNIEFDFSWRPDPREPAFIYVWGNQHNDAVKEPTVEYHVPGATDRKYMYDRVAIVKANKKNFKQLIKNVSFDFSWRPDPDSPPYIYVWGNQWNSVDVEPTLEYHVPGATERKYMTDKVAIVPESRKNWKILVEGATFDFSWRPDPREPAFVYVWGNKWNDSATEPTIMYHMEGATDKKYMNDLVATLSPTKMNWAVNRKEDLENFDFSWRPNPHSPPQIYQWEDNGPTYTVPGATAVVFMKRDDKTKVSATPRYYIKTSLEDLIEEHLDEVFWALNSDLSYEKFDFNWKPDESNFRHINVFGNELSKDVQTYYVNGPMYKLGHRDYNYVMEQSIIVDSNLSMFYIDTGLSDCSERFANLKLRYPQLQKTRFLNSWVETITRCVKKSETKLFYVLSSDLDYTDFDFDFYPSKWQMNMLHVFGNQYSHWGNTYLINGEAFLKDTKYVKVIEHLKNINHVRGKRAKTIVCKHDILYIDHGNLDDGINDKIFSNIGRKVFKTTYNTSYLKTLKNFISENQSLLAKQNYFIWVTNSICDYTDFDFSWQHDPFQFEQLHVFSSELNKARQKFGDTFLINLHEFSKYIEELTSLEEYKNKVNYIENVTATRKQHPVIKHGYDSQADGIKNFSSEYFPYYEFITADATNPKAIVPSLWDNKTSVTVGSKGASDIYVPHVAIRSIKDEVYDYPYIDNAKQMSESNPLDIVFISNGEPIADDNYETLLTSLKKRNIPNRVTRIKDVNGRVASQHAAANTSGTNWYFLVNGKVKVNDSFDWMWQPDRLQQPKHYIFTVTNPVNGLIYGHQAIVANNKNLTLNTVMKGLDFTLDSLHEVVDMNCGTAIYNTDAWTTWRTAFRESIKLRNNNDATSKFRLGRWTSKGVGNFAEISQRGALDGVEYFENVNGELSKLLLTYDWEWIRSYYNSKYGK